MRAEISTFWVQLLCTYLFRSIFIWPYHTTNFCCDYSLSVSQLRLPAQKQPLVLKTLSVSRATFSSLGSLWGTGFEERNHNKSISGMVWEFPKFWSQNGDCKIHIFEETYQFSLCPKSFQQGAQGLMHDSLKMPTSVGGFIELHVIELKSGKLGSLRVR